jgi:hypothetical protein
MLTHSERIVVGYFSNGRISGQQNGKMRQNRGKLTMGANFRTGGRFLIASGEGSS